MEIHGHCDEKFARVREAFAKNFAERGDVGASYAATLEGEFVVDLWGGHLDEARTRPWEEDTIVNVYSTTKTMTFLVSLMLADQGRLDLDAPVARYWPEFAQSGKGQVLVRHLLSHSAGLPLFSRTLSAEELCDWNCAIADLEAQAPLWEPGSAPGYHAITQGQLIGEVVCRITGKSFGQHFKEAVADPVGADFHIGVDPRHFPRIAELVPPANAMLDETDPDSLLAKVIQNQPLDIHNTELWRRAELPAANGHGNARSVVRAQTAMANGGKAFGAELLSAEGAARALEVQFNGDAPDKVLMAPVRYGLGYGIPWEGMPLYPGDSTLFWGGNGGSTIIIDTSAHLCQSYVMNQMTTIIFDDPRGQSLSQALYASLP